MPTQQPVAEPLDTQQLLRVLTALKKGDFAARLPLDWTGVRGSNSRCLPRDPSLHLNQTLFRRLTPPPRSNRVGILAETGAVRCQKVILFVP